MSNTSVETTNPTNTCGPTNISKGSNMRVEKYNNILDDRLPSNHAADNDYEDIPQPYNRLHVNTEYLESLIDNVIVKKARLQDLSPPKDRTKEKMIKYYSNKDNQLNLQKRIKKYKDIVKTYQLKIAELEQFIMDTDK